MKVTTIANTKIYVETLIQGEKPWENFQFSYYFLMPHNNTRMEINRQHEPKIKKERINKVT